MPSKRSQIPVLTCQTQQADLGTARREHVSTMDDPKKISRVRMEDLEAQRASNIRGTASQREAAQKQPALDAWKSLCIPKKRNLNVAYLLD